MMEKEEAIFLARKAIKDSIYNLVQFENLNVTFPETETIIDGGHVSGIDDYEIKVILNLKKDWLHVINHPSKKITIDEIKELNKIIGHNLILEEGTFRTRPNKVGGYHQEIPPLSVKKIQEKIDLINQISDPINKVCEWICFAILNQLFWDANKRTAFLTANKILIAENIGVLSISQNNLMEFNLKLNSYYNDRAENKKQEFIQVLEKNIQFTNSYQKRIK